MNTSALALAAARGVLALLQVAINKEPADSGTRALLIASYDDLSDEITHAMDKGDVTDVDSILSEGN